MAQKNKYTTSICAFFLPIALVLLAFAVLGVYPFGDKTLLVVDMHNEYIDYLAQMRETIYHSGSLLRSWNMGMGLNMLGLIAFYTASPFNILVLLLPQGSITEAVLLITLLKIGLGGLFFARYTAYVFPRVHSIYAVAFSVAYALMAYNIAYSSNIMWLDGTAFLPLALLGAEKILRENKFRLFLGSLVYVFFTSYYIGYMIGIFAFLYFTACFFCTSGNLREYLGKLGRFCAAALLAAGCCAFLLIPAYLNLKNGQQALWSIPFEPALKYPLVRLAAKLLPGTYDSLTDSGLPNIYCTVFAVLLLALFFCTSAVKLREKLIMGALLGFVLLCFSCGFLDLAWHAFEDPTWFPARYSFVFSFLILHLGLRCVCVLQKITQRQLAFAAGICLLLFVEIGVNRFRMAGLKQLVEALALLFLYVVLLGFCKKAGRAVLVFLLILVCAESWGNASAMFMGIDRQFQYKSRTEYLAFMQNYGQAVQMAQSLDAGVYRTEIVGQRGPNGGMALGYNGISHYSTTTDQALNQFLRAWGYNKGTVNELRFAPNTPVTNGLLGIRYLLSPQGYSGAYTQLAAVNGIGVLQNSCAWPLAFWGPDSALAFTSTQSDPFLSQNEYIRAALGEDIPVFTPVTASGPQLENTVLKQADYMEFTRQNAAQQATVSYQLENPLGREVYAFFPIYREKYTPAQVLVNGEPLQKDFAYRNNTVLFLGTSEQITVTIVLNSERLRIENAYFAAFDLAAAQKAAQIAGSRAVQFEDFADTRVTGKITVPQDCVLLSTFPLDTGWRVLTDGEKQPLRQFSGVFMAISLPRGEHAITMWYSPPGLLPGLAISLLCIAGIGFYAFKRRRIA